ncbi:MAG TPA: class I SAM-dependent methyltransferase [Actinomycetales bacterium]|nr:class I SAM-dependent methyltransferase [Actinomycetales bacterium]
MAVPESHPPAPTGERTVAGLWHENYWFARHEAGYLAALPFVSGVVADAGCGEGDGSRLLTSAGCTVVGLDYDAGCLSRSAAPGVRCNLVALPLASGSVDTVVTLQVLEHLWTPVAFLAECVRVLRPGGRLVVTTPNRLTFSPALARNTKPANVFHARELDADELAAEIGAHLTVEHVLGVHHGPRLTGTSVVARQLAAPYPEWEDGLRDLVSGVRAPDFVVSPDDVDVSLDLLVVAHR